MNAAEAVAQYRKAASSLRRRRYWAGSPPRTAAAAIKDQGKMSDALAFLRSINLTKVEDHLREERRLLDSAYSTEDREPEEAARKRAAAKQQQYRVSRLIKGR